MVLAAEWVSEPLWMGTENLDFTGAGTQDRPARSKSLFYVHRTPSTDVVVNLTTLMPMTSIRQNPSHLED
jgi:hypothetical protein